MPVQYGNGLVKEVPGVVLKIGNSGVQVRLEDKRELWISRGKLKHAVQNAEQAEPPTRMEDATMKNSKPLTAPLGQIANLPSQSEIDVEGLRKLGASLQNRIKAAPPASAIEQLEKQGLDPFQIWLDMGNALLVRQNAAVEAAEREMETKKANYRAAQQILADAEREVQAAQDTVDAAKLARDEIVRRTGAGK